MAVIMVGSLEHTDSDFQGNMAGKSTDLKFLEMGVFMSSLNCHQIKFALGALFPKSLLSRTSVRQHFSDSDLLSWSSSVCAHH